MPHTTYNITQFRSRPPKKAKRLSVTKATTGEVKQSSKTHGNIIKAINWPTSNNNLTKTTLEQFKTNNLT